MPALYPYLVSSLPMLSFGAAPPFSYAAFLEQCRERIPESDYPWLERVPQLALDNRGDVGIALLKEWFTFEIALRNALAAERAGRRHKDPALYLRQCRLFQASLEQLAQSALRMPSPLEAERVLDQARWDKLGELSLGHYFDLETLIIYAYKLLILLRWEKIRRADSARLLEEAMLNERGAV